MKAEKAIELTKKSVIWHDIQYETEQQILTLIHRTARKHAEYNYKKWKKENPEEFERYANALEWDLQDYIGI